MGIIECVPNISEGRNQKIIKEITHAVTKTRGVKLLGVDSGLDVNRTVITFAGDTGPVQEAAFNCIKKACELIDMSKHSGKHIRQGCVDVCPFVPVHRSTMQSCIEAACALGARVGSEIGAPVYLYGQAAAEISRQNLSFLRNGQYEHLAIKMQNLPPDYGTQTFDALVKKTGAICIGARDFLIAFNINVDTKDLDAVKKLAAILRESGPQRSGGGILKAVKAVGWYIEEYGKCQVSMNIEDYKKSPLYFVYETAKTEAKKLNLKISGCEIVGLVPKDAMLETAKFYLNKQGRITLGMAMRDVMQIVTDNLNLNDISPFDYKEKVLEIKIKETL